ncbi:MAG: hypothetical protein KKE76_11585 [Gammaproteobacteria bacterium]|nr:hypothetical protein [Gammaproteobacteria bacterium]
MHKQISPFAYRALLTTRNTGRSGIGCIEIFQAKRSRVPESRCSYSTASELFREKLTTSKRVSLANCSQDTAYRDIHDLGERRAWTGLGGICISEMMQALGRRYTYYRNHEYQQTGTLWERHFQAALIDTEAYLLTCMRYIE